MKQVILHLTSAHSGFDCRIFYKEALSLAKHYRVVVISPGIQGKIFDMLKKNLFDEGYYNGILELCFLPRSILLKYLTIRYVRSIIRKLYLLFGYYFISKKLKKYNIKPDVIHFHEPELFSIVFKLKHKYKCKVIFDTHELHISYLFDKFSFPLNFILSFFAICRYKKFFKFLDATISVNNTIKALNMCFNPYIPHEIIYNASLFNMHDDSSENINMSLIKSSETILLVHEGTIGFNRGFKIMCDLFKNELFRNKYKLRIVGAIRGKELDYFKYRLKTEPWLKDCIEETGWVDYLDVPKFLRGAHIGLILMEPLYNNLLAGPPNKLFNYTAFSIPVLSFDIPPTSELINRYGVGVISDRNIDSLYNSLDILVNNYDEFISNINKHKFAFVWETQEKKLLEFYNKILS